MLTGFYVFHSTSPVYTSPMHRRGLAALFSLEVTEFSGNLLLKVVVEHKNHDETSWSGAGFFSDISNVTGVGTYEKYISGLREDVRLTFYFTNGSAGDFVHVVLPAPSWRPY